MKKGMPYKNLVPDFACQRLVDIMTVLRPLKVALLFN